MDVVEVVNGVNPFAAGVIGLEAEVWREGPALAGCEVGSYEILLTQILRLVGWGIFTHQLRLHQGTCLQSPCKGQSS